MKKNKIMRFASLVLVLTLLSTCAISGTFAKYTTSVSSQDTARVAKWGFTESSIDLSNLFKTAYINDEMTAAADAIAPGTTNSATFKFTYGGQSGINAPEVAYTFTVSTDGSLIDDSIKNNTNIQWKLDSGEWGTWDAMITAIKTLSGDSTGTKTYAPGELPTAFGTSNTEHTISWQWVFESTGEGQPATQDATDTGMGNATDLADVTIKITITATQIDTHTKVTNP